MDTGLYSRVKEFKLLVVADAGSKVADQMREVVSPHPVCVCVPDVVKSLMATVQYDIVFVHPTGLFLWMDRVNELAAQMGAFVIVLMDEFNEFAFSRALQYGAKFVAVWPGEDPEAVMEVVLDLFKKQKEGSDE